MPAEKRELVDYARTQHKCSLRLACLLFSLSTSVHYYKAKCNPQDDLIEQEL